jgi:predicted dehydrogenase
MSSLRVGLVGYGAGGRRFHAPFIQAATGLELTAVVARSPERRAELAADLPGVPAVDSLADLLAEGVDLVVISTPPATRRDLVLQALAAGVPVVADKPFAPHGAIARELEQAAAAAGLPLNAFHNRRWDADIRTVKAVLESGAVGAPKTFESRFDLYEPHTVEAGPGGGVLSDLGSHLIDQALWLFGPVSSVYAELELVDTAGGRSDGGFFVALTHRTGIRSHLTASKLGRTAGRELRLTGSSGTYRSAGTDVQADAISAGRRPADDPAGWGFENEDRWGTLQTESGEVKVPSEQGSWQSFYEQVGLAITTGTDSPVPAAEAVAVIDVIDAARSSATHHRVVEL